jgi:hypothetical protein
MVGQDHEHRNYSHFDNHADPPGINERSSEITQLAPAVTPSSSTP